MRCGSKSLQAVSTRGPSGRHHLQSILWVRIGELEVGEGFPPFPLSCILICDSRMPSTHSATISYYAAFITLAARNLPVHPTLSSVPLFLINPVAPVLAVSCASVVCVSRIRLGHHTIKQVAAGICVGVVFGTGWFWLWSKGGAQDIARGLVDLLPNFISTLVR